MFELLLKIFKNEEGGLPKWMTWPFGQEGKEEIYDPYSDLRSQYSGYLGQKLGTRTPYEFNEQFQTEQPGVESAVESTILGRLQNLPSFTEGIQDIHGRYYGAQKEQMTERHAEEAKRTSDMYNRLGLVSSTPGLQAQSDLMRKQGQEFNVLGADIARQGIQDEMAATALAEDIINQYMTQGQVLGQAQRGYQQRAQQLSMADIERMVREEQGWAGLTGQTLGMQQPQREYTPSTGEQVLGASSDILPYIIMMMMA